MTEKEVGEKSGGWGWSRSLQLLQDECSKEKDNSYSKDAHVTLLILTRAVGRANVNMLVTPCFRWLSFLIFCIC